MQIKIAPSLGDGFAGTPEEAWGVSPYISDTEPTIFFGLYGLPDFYTLWRHKGKKYIFWAGSDIQHFLKGYWLDEEGKITMNPYALASWIDTYCESYVENEVEQQALRTVGIRSKIVPSFLGNTELYHICYTWSEKPKVYTSVSGDEFKLYGWDKIPKLARDNPDIEFHLYGNNVEFPCEPNMILHGRVPQEQMNEEIKQMQGALRLTEFDGFSELIAKAMLWGQQVFTLIPYPFTKHPDQLSSLLTIKEPNLAGRTWLLANVNKYPWNTNI